MIRKEQRLNRRQFIAKSATLSVAGLVPRHVLGGSNHIPPSDQLNVPVIGTGGQGITNIKTLLTHRDVKITAICDPAQFWDNSDLYYRHNGGRGPAMEVIEEHYRRNESEAHHGCKVYLDFRTMLEESGRMTCTIAASTRRQTARRRPFRTTSSVTCSPRHGLLPIA